MESIIEFYESNQRVFNALIFVIGLVVFYMLIRFFSRKGKDDNLNRNVNTRKGSDNPDESEDDEEPEDRFFRIPSYDLPDDWDDAFEVIVDRKTKVQYLCFGEYRITPFIDADGKPILYKDKYQDQEESE